MELAELELDADFAHCDKQQGNCDQRDRRDTEKHADNEDHLICGFHLWEIPHKSAPQSDAPILLKLRRLPHVNQHVVGFVDLEMF